MPRNPAPHATTSRRRVTLIGSLPPTKGVSPYTAALVDALSQRADVDLEVITFRSIYPSWLYPGGAPDEAGVRRDFACARVRRILDWYNPLGWLWAGLSLRGDVVHAQWWSYVLAPVYATVLGIARLRGKKVLLTVHNVEPHEQSLPKRLLNRLALRFADGYVVHSEANRASLAGRAGHGRAVTALPMGVMPASEQCLPQQDARDRLGLPREAEVVLNFGNIRPYKGVDVLLRAFATVVSERPNALLVIAGKPWGPWEPYQALIDRLGLAQRVRLFLDFVPTPEVDAYFAAANVVALPYTHFDAQSAVGALALPFAKPMVVSDAGGLPELVDPACVFPAGDHDALAHLLVRVLEDGELRARLAADSGRRANELGWGPIAARTAELYEALAA